MAGKIALIMGITGQDGAYLARFLLQRGYRVHGVVRPSSTPSTARLDHLDRLAGAGARHQGRLILHHGDVTETGGLVRLLHTVVPDEIYNLAAQTHVQVSFEMPEYTAEANALGVVRLLEAIRLLGLDKTVRFYQASTSELFGNACETPQRESTPFRPRSPYGAAKLYAYWITVNYREAHGLHASNGILFNHESPLRGETFVTRKITRGVAALQVGGAGPLRLGNLDARRDWGHAADYVEGMWRMLQQDVPGDYVLATGTARSVRTFVETAFAHVGRRVLWRGAGLDEQGVDADSGQVLVEVDPALVRPAEVHALCGDATKARDRLGWRPKIGFTALVREMMEADLAAAREGADA